MNRTQKIASAVALAAGATAAARYLARLSTGISFRGKTAIITGGSRGLGLCLARELALEGASVALLARDRDELARAAKQILLRGGRVVTIPCDVTQQEQVNAAVGEVVDHLGRVDLLINNAGTIQVGPLENLSVADFDHAIDLHIRAPLFTTLACLPYLSQSGQGRLVNISSIGGQVSVPHLLAYSASKFGLVGLSQGLRAELARYNVAVTTVCPGLLRTGSPRNALFKGQHQREFFWFAMFDSLPITSMNAVSAARKIIDAARHGDAQLTLTLSAKLAATANALFPGLTARAMALVSGLLPGPVDSDEANTLRPGYEVRPPSMPSYLTALSDRAAVENNEVAS